MFTKFKFTLILICSLFSFFASADYKSMGEEDVLFTVSKKLKLIEQRLNNQFVLISPETLNWPEIEDFNEELMYVVAHDPQGPLLKETPVELTSEKLTEQLRSSWLRLEESVHKIGTLVQNEEWTSLKVDVDQFFSYREALLYQPARVMIKTGLLSSKIKALRLAASKLMNDSQKGNKISFHVNDPVIEGLSKELTVLNVSVKQLEELRRPKKKEPTTIFQSKHYPELTLLAGVALGAGAVVAALFFWVGGIISRYKQRKLAEKLQAIEIKPRTPAANQFDYNEWIKRLEKNLLTLKKNEDNLTEDILCLINYSHELRDARKLLNQVDSQQDFDTRLQSLNAASSKIELYFEKINFKKNTDTSKNILKHLIELCEAIENGHEIKLKDKDETTTKAA